MANLKASSVLTMGGCLPFVPNISGFHTGGWETGDSPLPPGTSHQIELLDSFVMGGVGHSLPFGR